MNTRRDALRDAFRLLAILPAAAAAQEAHEVESQPGHLHAGPAIKAPSPLALTFFQAAEFEIVEAMTERIIPRSDTPGAKDAGVALLIDRAIMVKPALGPQYRAGLADLNALALAAYGGEFVALDEQKQNAVLLPLSLGGDSPQAQFFTLVKNMTVDAYYKTEAGLTQELGWHGNTYLDSFPGCEHPGHHA